MKYVEGNLIDMAESGDFDIIVHGCNIFNTFGSGIAAEIRERVPQAYEADCLTLKGDKRKLGLFTWATMDSGCSVHNLYTQGAMGRNGVHVDYDAIERGFLQIKMIEQSSGVGFRVGIPKIGAGLGGGDWDRIESIIDAMELSDVTCVVLPGTPGKSIEVDCTLDFDDDPDITSR